MTTAGRAADVGPPQRQAVLAALAADAGRHVPVELLIDRVWDGDPPDRARRALQVHVARIRQALPGPLLLRRSGGYLLDVDPETVDLHRFRRLIETSRRPGPLDPERLSQLRTALALWRGEPLAGLTGTWVDGIREAWRRHRVDATIAASDAELRIGLDPGPAIAALTELAVEHPLVEPLAAALMRALQAAGRPEDALRHYARIRRRLVDELGVEPHAELRDAHRRVLHDDPAPAPPTPGLGISLGIGLVPAQLPMDVSNFTGRAELLADLDTLIADQPGPAVATLSGTAGVGKSALAVHWGHRSRTSFPDGQLYLNLRGACETTAMPPGDALSGLLPALGVPAGQGPADVEQAAALYRSLLAGKRMLIVLDDARDFEQVRPLLPGAPGCLVLVTSRFSLSDLTARVGAHPLRVGPLGPEEAHALLYRLLGRDRVALDPAALADLVRTTRDRPLALRTAATELLSRN
jgi:DNA-binding SARP family transcriptional activator